MQATKINDLVVSSPAFTHEGMIPSKFTCDGDKINPPLNIRQIPEGTKSLAIIAEDPDAPGGTYDHWLVWNIKPTATINEQANPGTSGRNTAGKTGYHPPCPPSGSHRYYFHVYALDRNLDLLAGEGKKALEQAMQSHILAKGTLMGRYERG